MMCFRRPAKRHTKSKHGKPSKGTVEAVQVANPPASPMKDEGVVVEYITTRLIAESSDEKFAESLQTAASALRSSHGAHFKVWSVSRRRRDVTTSLEAVQVGWPPDVAPPLERICTVCKSIDQWLLEHPLNVAVLFCKGAFYRAAIIVDAFMRYNAISATDDAIDDRFNMKRFADRNLILDGPPSYKRYMNYFTSLLSGRILVNPAPLHLRLVTLKHFQPGNVYLKVYERLLPVFQSKNVALKETTKIEVGDLRLRGDVFIKCVLVSTVAAKNESGKVLFTCQLNTCSLVVPPTTDGSPTLLRLHKEELDLIFNDKKVDNRALLELSVSHDSSEPSTSKPNSRPNSSSSARNSLVRPNSYEAFDTLEDEGTNLGNAEVEYSEIKKHKVDDKMSVPPPVPPKPTMNGDIVEMPERRGVLPAQVRALVNQNKALEGRATPSIEPDLVGKDRYDKASRCFSYVPAKSMKEAFEKPRRPSFSRAIERREESVERVSQDDVARASIPRSVESRVDSPATWDEQVENAKQAALLEELARGIPSRQNYQQMPSDYGSDDTQQAQFQVVDQAQRAVVTPTSTLQRRASRERGSRYGSYRTLNDDAYCSDMDDLCDPDYYMNFSHPATPSTTTAPAPPMRHAGARSVQLPRRKLQPVEAFTDPLDDVLESTKRLNSAHSVGDVRTATNGAAVQDAFRNRHCQSVSSAKAPNHEENDEADSWLSGKLKKVRSKRDIDPDLVRRRTQEKMLLEELKDQRNEDNFNEGKGVQNVDPLLEFRREEERLKNTRSPYDERSWRGRMRGKPPTPPPREASASPVCHSGPPPSQGRQRHNASVPPSHHYVDEDFDVNSILNYNPYARDDQQDRGRSLSRGARIQDAWYSSQQDLPAKFYSGQERVAAAIFRAETPHRDLYASGTINRAETPGRYFPENSAVLERSATPSFPVARTTPVPFHPLLYNGSSNNNTINTRAGSPRHFGNGSVQLSRRSSVNSVDTSEIIHHHPLFVKDTSKYWYKPTISREQAISMLRDKQPGTFVVRDSNSFPGAFGLALKVAQAPPGVHPGDGTELVRHFLIEPSPKGVKLKGCNNEPVFGSLSALVYQHSITALALPTKLVLPDFDPAATPEHVSATQALLEQGAACNVVYVGSVDVESLTGAECVKRSIATCSQRVYDQLSRAVSVHFKVSSQGVTLTDNTRKVFFRRHFSVQSVIFAGMDPIERRFENQHALGFHDGCLAQARMFGFVARLPSSADNVCHVFAELEPEQPASAVVNFINKVMLAQKSR